MTDPFVTPGYFRFLTQIFSYLYLFVFAPATIFLAFYILIAYCANMIADSTLSILPHIRFRRGVATLLPFLMSLYTVLVTEVYKVSTILNLPFYVLLAIGFVVGCIFIYSISVIRNDQELFLSLSCFVASLIFFSILTAFVITQSLDIISFVFGFLFGVCLYVLQYGFSNLQRFTLKLPRLPRIFSRKSPPSPPPSSPIPPPPSSPIPPPPPPSSPIPPTGSQTSTRKP